MGCGGTKVTPSQQPLSTILPVDNSALAETDSQKTHAQKPIVPVDKRTLAETGSPKAHAQKPISGAYISLRTIEITIKKRSQNDRIGLNGAPSKNFWSVLDVQDGLVKLWNEQHPDMIVEEGDIIVACNGVQGDGEMVCEAMKHDMDLKITVAKKADVPPERSGPENHVDTSTEADDFPDDASEETAFVRQTTLDTAPESTKQKFPSSGCIT